MQNHVEVGQLEENEVKLIEAYRKTANDMIQQIGQLEVQKARLLGQMADVEERAQKVLNEAKQRFNVGQQPCFITADGKIMAVSDAPAAEQPH